MTKQTSQVCKLSNEIVDLFKNNYNRTATLDDLFQNEGSMNDIFTSLNNSQTDLEVSIRYSDLLDLRNEIATEGMNLDEKPSSFQDSKNGSDFKNSMKKNMSSYFNAMGKQNISQMGMFDRGQMI